jgi:hypothetical protein
VIPHPPAFAYVPRRAFGNDKHLRRCRLQDTKFRGGFITVIALPRGGGRGSNQMSKGPLVPVSKLSQHRVEPLPTMDDGRAMNFCFVGRQDCFWGAPMCARARPLDGQ